jgi:uncharacterized coiled-coil protein SlyX
METKRLVALVAACLAAAGCVLPIDAATAAEPASLDLRLFAVPVMEPGKAAWVSVYDQFGRPAPQSIVNLNGTPLVADTLGQVSFSVPDTTTVSLAVQTAEGKLSNTIIYERSAGGFLVAEKDAKDAVDRIEESVVSNEQAPAIAYAPSVIELSQAFVLIGKNWSGKADGDHILVDGYDADVFSGSSVCLLATSPRRMSVGALREMYVTTGAETSNTVEVDICKLDVSLQAGAVPGTEVARIKALGTNVPSLIDVRNLTPNTVALKFSDKQLGKKSALITSGGDSNGIELAVTRSGNGAFDLDAHLVADAPWSPDDRTTYGDAAKKKIIAELNKAEVVRLKRRLIAIEQRIGEEQEHRTNGLNGGVMTPAEMDRINAQLRSLSNRQRRINAMVVARRAVFQALGGTEEDYRAALDLAAGGSAIALDKQLAPLASAALLASTTQVARNPSEEDGLIEQALNVDRTKEMQQLAELTRMWKQFPHKVAHGTRLAPPPPPYVPDLSGQEMSFDYKSYVRLGAPPPPPPLVALMKKKSATKASPSKKHSRQRSKSRRR